MVLELIFSGIDYVIALKQKSKYSCLNNLDIYIYKKKPFWSLKYGCKACFSNKHSTEGTSITLIEKNKLIFHNTNISTTFID